MDICLMGTVEIRHDGDPVPLMRSGERCVLATLALSPGRRVRIDTLVDHVWGERPPTNAHHTVTSYVRTVRRALERANGQRDWLRSLRPGAYQLDVPPDRIDYHRFSALVAAARASQAVGDSTEAIVDYRRALDLRRGVALADVTGDWAEHRRYAIEQECLDALCDLYEQQLEVGDFAEVATSASHLIADVVPTDRMIILALRALAGGGHRARIADFVDRANRRMWDAAGAGPSADVHRVARKLTASVDPAPGPPPPKESPDAGGTDPPSVPTIVLTASNSGQVYQAAGDQYIGVSGRQSVAAGGRRRIPPPATIGP